MLRSPALKRAAASARVSYIKGMANDAPQPPKKPDVVLLGPPTSDGDGVHVLRAREERIETGELRALREGKPVVGEIVSLKPREGNPRVCDVESTFTPPAQAKGPAQVATPAYRENWDQIFAKKTDATLN